MRLSQQVGMALHLGRLARGSIEHQANLFYRQVPVLVGLVEGGWSRNKCGRNIHKIACLSHFEKSSLQLVDGSLE